MILSKQRFTMFPTARAQALILLAILATSQAATLPGCLNSTLGYACAQPLNAGGTTLHFTQ
ncbi:hypothetical protein HaLaN_08549, partial [Haematococcus lacustris]